MSGRPTKLDDLTTKRILDAVAKGYPRDTAAKLARIAPSTLYLWLRKGRAGEPLYSEFSERIKEAEAKGEAELVDRIRDASRSTWQAAAWLLERRRPKVYALRRETRESTRPAVGMSDVTDESLLPLLENYVETLRSKKGRRDA